MIFAVPTLRRRLLSPRPKLFLQPKQLKRLYSIKEDLSPAVGTKDIFGVQLNKFTFLIETAKRHFQYYGLKEILTSPIENPAAFKKFLGLKNDFVKEMFVLRTIDAVLRPDFTVPTLRAYVNNPRWSSPDELASLYYHGPIFRNQKHPYLLLERHQIGAEFLGSASIMADLDCLECARSLLEKWGIRNTVLKINTLGDRDTRAKYIKVLKEYLENNKKNLSEKSQGRLERGSYLSIYSSYEEEDQQIIEKSPKIIDYLTPVSLDRWNDLCKDLTALGIPYTIDPNLVRHEYYDSLVFKFTASIPRAPDSPEQTVISGGRYDDFTLYNMGTHLPGVGFAGFLEPLALSLNETLFFDNPMTIMVVSIPSLKDDELTTKIRRYALDIAKDLRRNNLSVLSMMSDVRVERQVIRANRSAAAWGIYVGEDELKKSTLKVRDMVSHKERFVEREKLLPYLLRDSKNYVQNTDQNHSVR